MDGFQYPGGQPTGYGAGPAGPVPPAASYAPYGQSAYPVPGQQPAYGQPAYPVSGQQPAYGQPAYPVSGQQPVYGQPAYSAPGQQPVYGQPAYPVPGQQLAYGQPAGPAYLPNGPYGVPQPVYYAPPFARKPARDPRRVGAEKTFNRMCLIVLLQTAAAYIFMFPLTRASLLAGVNVVSDAMAYQLLSAVMVPLSTALPFFVYLLIKRREARDYLRFEKVGFATALLCVLAGLAVCMLANFPAFAIQDFFSRFGYEPAGDVVPGEDSWPMLVIELLSTAVLVPVMEEFAFRGVLFSALRRFGTGFAIVGSALVFSLVHLDFANVVFAFIAGLVFGFLYARTGNLWVTVCIHALNNAIAVIGSYGEFLFGVGSELMEMLFMVVPIVLGLLALLILLLWKRKWLFGRRPVQTVRPLSTGEAAATMTRVPLFWVIVAMMAAYTTTLFF